jgi:hypothetical protein
LYSEVRPLLDGYVDALSMTVVTSTSRRTLEAEC